MTNIISSYYSCVSSLLLAMLCMAMSFSSADILPPEQAFVFDYSMSGSQVKLHWDIADGHYLYKKRITISSAEMNSLPALNFTSQASLKQDKNFGESEVFFDQLEADFYLAENLINTQSKPSIKVNVSYQGCAKSGFCYLPQRKQMLISLPAISSSSVAESKLTSAVIKSENTAVLPDSNTATATKSGLASLGSSSGISAFLQDSGFIATVFIFALLGLGLSFTPCVLPMVPILSSIIVSQSKSLTVAKGSLLSLSYVLGMSVSYAAAGILVASLGAKANVHMYMQSPWVISLVALLFVGLALSMFGFFTLQLPAGLQNKLNSISTNKQGASYFSIFVMGAISALVVSPCVSAPLAGVLMYISSTGDTVLGGSALFALGLGMGIPLIMIGAGSGKFIPKAGAWMNAVKEFFGVVLLAVAIWLLGRFMPNSVSLLLWAALAIFYAIHNGAIDHAEVGFARFKKGFHFIVLFYGVFMLYQGLQQIHSVTTNSGDGTQAAVLSENHNQLAAKSLFTRVANAGELEQQIKTAVEDGQTVMLDFYADWCAACVEMEQDVFNKLSVRNALANYKVLQIDLTHNRPDDRSILDRFNLFGPPSILFFDAAGKELTKARVQGEMSETQFLDHLQLFKPTKH